MGGGRNNAVLPRVEVDNLLTAVFEAVDLAAEGHVAGGYQVLLLGNQRALEGEGNFEPWAEGWKGAGTRRLSGTSRAPPVDT